MTIIFILKFIGFLIICGIIFAIMISCIHYFKTIWLRKNIKKFDICKFYINEFKYIGKVIERLGNQVKVEFMDDNGKIEKRIIHINNIYPAW